MSQKNKLFIIAGPCVIESKSLLYITADELKSVCNELGLELIFKSSYKKANRTSRESFTGIGDIQALEYLKETGLKYNLKTLTDVHSVEEVELAANYVDILQIPAFLSRQTELLNAVGMTGKPVNIKKGQFMAPEDMAHAASKVGYEDKSKIWLTERGTTFGYHDLVVDFRSLLIMRSFGYPVIFDATHSLQQPSKGTQSGGLPQFVPALGRAAAAVGIDGLFFETHPDPPRALSDSATQMPLDQVKPFLEDICRIASVINSRS